MAENLFPENFTDASQTVSISETDDTFSGYKPSYYFDFQTGDFLRDGTNKVMTSTGTDAWVQWCIKNISTPRYDCLAYSTDFGISHKLISEYSSRAEFENDMTREITEALQADPYERLNYIDSILFEWEDDTTVEVTCVLVGVDGNTVVLETTIKQ